MTEAHHHSPEELAEQLKHLAIQLQAMGRKDLLLHALGAPLLEELRIEAARAKLSRLLITKDYRFFLADLGQQRGGTATRAQSRLSVVLGTSRGHRVQATGRLSGGADRLLHGHSKDDGQRENCRKH